jgi:hypothetical protein
LIALFSRTKTSMASRRAKKTTMPLVDALDTKP